MHSPLLFSFQLLNLAFVSAVDNNQHVQIGQSVAGTYSVVKNGCKIRKLFSIFQQLNTRLICYSNKKYNICSPVIKAINPNLQWTYIITDKNKMEQLSANHAVLHKLQNGMQTISYGQGLSGCQGKQQLRIAICSALKIDLQTSKTKLLIFEDYMQQINKLKQQGYKNIYCSIPNTEEQLSNLRQQLKNKLLNNQIFINNKQYQQLIKNTPNLQDADFVDRVLDFHYLENKKNVTVSIGLALKNSPPPIYRPPSSYSICSLVFRYSADKQIYIAKSQLPHKIGGQMYHQAQQNKILASVIYQTLVQNSKNNSKYKRIICLPMYLSNFNMRNSLIKGYNNNKAWFIVRPFIKGFKTISQQLSTKNQQEQAVLLLKEGRFKDKIVKGIGRIIALSMLCNQKLIVKGLLDTICLYPSNTKQCIMDQKYQNQLYCCRTDISECFRQGKNQQLQQIEIKILSSGLKIKLNELYPLFIEQIQQTIKQICQFLPLIQSIFTHYIWTFNKNNQLNIFNNQLINIYNTFIQKNKDNKNTMHHLQKLININEINPRLINYIISSSPKQTFQYFRKQDQDKQLRMYATYNFTNIYERKIKQNGNFIIYGSNLPIISLIKWIKYIQPNKQIRYLSLLHITPQAFIKHLKRAKTQQKKNILFIVDYCQIDELTLNSRRVNIGSAQEKQVDQVKPITDINYGIRTIFIYRLKLGQCKKLQILHDPLTLNRQGQFCLTQKIKLPHSYEQIFKTIFSINKNINKNTQNLFDSYRNAIDLYIKNKWLTLGIRVGIHKLSILTQKLELLVRSIAMNNNRLLHILKAKQFNDFQLYYNQTIPFYSYSYHHPQSVQQHNHMNMSMSMNMNMREGQKDTLQHVRKVPKALIVLYCLPIYIYNQRVWLIHDIYQYMSSYYLYMQIINTSWNGILYGQQLQNIKKWHSRMSTCQKHNLQTKLLQTLTKLQAIKANKLKNQKYLSQSDEAVSDCLELCHSLGLHHIFCKLHNIFDVCGQLRQFVCVDQQLCSQFVAVTVNNSIYCIQKQFKQGKQQWKMSTLHKTNQNKQQKYKIIGSTAQKTQQIIQITTTWAQLNPKGTYSIHQNTLNIRQYNITNTNKYIQKQMMIKFNDIMDGCVINLRMVDDQYIVVVFDTGYVAIGCMEIGDNIISVTKWINMHSTHTPWKLTQQHNNNNNQQKLFKFNINSNIKITSTKLNDNNYYIAIAVSCNQQQYLPIKQNQDKLYVFAVLGVHVIRNSPQDYSVKSTIADVYANRNKIKDINISIKNNGNQRYIQILTFQQVTDALLIWKSTQNKTNSVITTPVSKHYRVQNQPVWAQKFNNTLFVASKYEFIKRMTIIEHIPPATTLTQSKNTENSQQVTKIPVKLVQQNHSSQYK